MDYGQLAHIVGRADRTIGPQTVVEHWDRMGQFYASLESGHTTASVALQRLVSCTAKNHFYRAALRDIYYGRRGRINARELHEQMNSCSCLTLLLACVVYWQAKEISRVLKMGIPEGEDIDMSILEHVSPIEWENVILYGQYVLNPDDIR